MIRIVAKGFKEAKKELARIEKQIPYATARALTFTAKAAKQDIESEMRSVFDRPTRWTLNSLYLEAARKDKLQARVGVKGDATRGDPPTKWLTPEVHGGTRSPKPSERALRQRGLLPPGKYVLPGKGMKLDSFGNVSGPRMKSILERIGLKPQQEDGKPKNRRSVFVIRRGNQPIGIAERTGKGADKMSVILAFGRRPTYKRRLDFYRIADKAIAVNLNREMKKALAHALRTAR